MTNKMSAVLWRLGIFVLVCALGAFSLITVFAQLRFEREQTYAAVFTNVSGLKSEDFVRIAGVEVGKVQTITVRDDSTVQVEFGADDSVVLTDGSRAVIKYDNLIGDRYLAIEEGTGGTKKLRPGDTIPLNRTAPALDLDAVIGGFRPLFRALDPAQVNTLTSQLIAAFQGQGATIGSILAQTAALTNTLADRDELIGQTIVNLNAVGIAGRAQRSIRQGCRLAVAASARAANPQAGHQQRSGLRQRGCPIDRRPSRTSTTTASKSCQRDRSHRGCCACRS